MCDTNWTVLDTSKASVRGQHEVNLATSLLLWLWMDSQHSKVHASAHYEMHVILIAVWLRCECHLFMVYFFTFISIHNS